MSVLTPGQIASYASNAGFPASEVPTAVGVAIAESGGNTTAHNPKPPDDSYGLWQINMIGAMGPDRRKRLGISSNSELYKPEVNAKAAHMVWKQQGWSKGWTTYSNGDAQRAVKELSAGALKGFEGALTPHNPVDAALGKASDVERKVNEVTSGLESIGPAITKGLEGMEGWFVGIALVGMGLLILFRKPVGKAVGATADTVL